MSKKDLDPNEFAPKPTDTERGRGGFDNDHDRDWNRPTRSAQGRSDAAGPPPERPKEATITIKARAEDVERFRALCREDPETLSKRTQAQVLRLLLNTYDVTTG